MTGACTEQNNNNYKLATTRIKKMVCWIKTVVAMATVVSFWARGAGASPRRIGQQSYPRPEALNSSLSPAMRSSLFSTSKGECERAEVIRNETAQLFSRQLTKDEYYQRNFMWMRCRGTRSPFFDLGGSWFGHNGEDLKRMIDGPMPIRVWQFKYVNAVRPGISNDGWGDAELFVNPWYPVKLDEAVSVIREFGRKEAAKYRRSFYIIDCPGFEMDPSWATERSTIDFPNPARVPAREQLVTVYNNDH